MLMNTTFLEDSFLIKWQSRDIPRTDLTFSGYLRLGRLSLDRHFPYVRLPDFATCFILTIEKNVENTALGLYFL